MNLSGYLLLLMFALFLGIVFWAYHPKTKKRHEEAAQSILTDND